MSTASQLPPGALANLFGIGLFPLGRDPLKYMTQLAERYGDIVYFRSGRERFFLLNHPDYIKDLLLTSARKFAKGRALERSRLLLGQGLLTSEGDFHLRQRRLMQPVFHRQRIAGYAEAMVAFAARLRERWSDEQVIDIHQQMTGLTLAIAGKTLFDADVEGDTHEVVEAISEAFSLFHLTLTPLSELLEKIPFSPIRKLHRSRQRLDRIIYRIIENRRQSGSLYGGHWKSTSSGHTRFRGGHWLLPVNGSRITMRAIFPIRTNSIPAAGLRRPVPPATSSAIFRSPPVRANASAKASPG